MVVGEVPDRLALSVQLHATLHQHLLNLPDLFEDPVCHRLVGSGHNLSADCSSGEPEGKNSKCIPSGTSTSPPVCHPARSTTKSTRLSLPAPTSPANSASAIENSLTLTVGRISQKTFPLSGHTGAAMFRFPTTPEDRR